jgi:AGCS family alanine or glycine:cation symporter
MIYRLIYIPLIAVGSIGGLHQLWDLSDTLNGLMAIPNLIGLLLLSPIVIRRTREFFSKEFLDEEKEAV